MTDDMPNGDCDCGDVPFRHLDSCGHVPTCGNWTWSMLWQERLGRNLAAAGALCASFDLGQRFEEPFPLGPRDRDEAEKARAEIWTPGCGRSAR